MCLTCLDAVEAQGTGLILRVARGCMCSCPNVPHEEKAPVQSEEICDLCGHPHASNEVTLQTAEGPRRGRVRLNATTRT